MVHAPACTIPQSMTPCGMKSCGYKSRLLLGGLQAPDWHVRGAAQNNTLGMMGVSNCTGLTVTNAFTYYQTPPFTQATLVDISADQLTWTIQARAALSRRF